MRKFLSFLFVFIFLSPSIKPGSNINMKRDKLVELTEKLKSDSTFVKEELIKDSLDWKIAKASFYDSNDPKQTKIDCDGLGRSGRRIKSGSIALGSTFTKNFIEKKIIIFIQVKDCKVVTPYGKGIFRVDDTMNDRYNIKDKFFVDFFYKDVNSNQKQLGRFHIKFRIFKIVKPDNDNLSLSGFYFNFLKSFPHIFFVIL